MARVSWELGEAHACDLSTWEERQEESESESQTELCEGSL